MASSKQHPRSSTQNRSCQKIPADIPRIPGGCEAMLVSSLPFVGFNDRDEKAVVDFQGSRKMPRDVRGPWDDSRTENAGEHLVAAREVTVTQTSNEFSAAEPNRACAVQNQSPDGVRVLVISR